MSKVSIQGDQNGTGDFTIKAPNSNVDRTLNLPDEAGKLLSTGNNDPAEVFKQSNILGTVSESGGVPTGAIIERGSNANGEFVKFADGTMIARVIIPQADVSSGETVLFAEHPWPVEFSSPGQFGVICTSRSTTPSPAADLIIGIGSGAGRRTDTTVVSVAMKNTNTSSTRTARPNVFKFGRWY